MINVDGVLTYLIAGSLMISLALLSYLFVLRVRMLLLQRTLNRLKNGHDSDVPYDVDELGTLCPKCGHENKDPKSQSDLADRCSICGATNLLVVKISISKGKVTRSAIITRTMTKGDASK
jgi:hypothetical protein